MLESTPLKDAESFLEYYWLVSQLGWGGGGRKPKTKHFITSLCLIRPSSFKINSLVPIMEIIPLIRVCHVTASAC